MEAHKWALYNCAFHFTDIPDPTLAMAGSALPGSNGFNKRLLALRQDLRFDRVYIIRVPLHVTVIHAKTVLSIKNDQAGGQRD